MNWFLSQWQATHKQAPPRSVSLTRKRQPRLRVESLEHRLVLSTLRTILYDQITALPSDTALHAGSAYNVLSANGNRAVLLTYGPTGDQIYTVNSDGSNLTLVDPNPNPAVGGYEQLDISADGSVVLETLLHGGNPSADLRIVNADGSNLHAAFDHADSGTTARLSADGKTVFFEDPRGFTIDSQRFGPGLYAVAAGGSTPQLIVSDAQVAAVLGTTASNVFLSSDGGYGIDLDISGDGQHLVFAAARTNLGGESLLGVNRDGSGLHLIGAPPIPGNYVLMAGISGDGHTAFRYDTGSPSNPQVTVYHFDGGGALTLNVPAGLLANTNPPEHVQLTQDGSKLLLGSTGLLINTDNSGIVQIGTNVGLDTSTAPTYALVHSGLYRATMDSSGSVFLYIASDTKGTAQLAVARLNPTSLGAAPAVSNVTISPSYLVTEKRSATTIRAVVSGSSRPVGASEAVLRDGVSEQAYLQDHTDDRLYDDGTHGDDADGDGTYINNGVTIAYDPPTGPRTVRVSAETVDSNGLQHVTSVEVNGLYVTVNVPTLTSTTVTSSQNSSVFGQAVTFTATVTPVASGAGTPTGTVTFWDGNSLLGTATLANGQALFTTSALTVGSHAITVDYSGDPGSAPSSSAVLTQTVNAVPVLPPAPTGLTWTPTTGDDGILSWSNVVGALGYDIYFFNPYTDQWVSLVRLDASATTLTIHNGTGFYFMVGAYNTAGEAFSQVLYAGDGQLPTP